MLLELAPLLELALTLALAALLPLPLLLPLTLSGEALRLPLKLLLGLALGLREPGAELPLRPALALAPLLGVAAELTLPRLLPDYSLTQLPPPRQSHLQLPPVVDYPLLSVHYYYCCWCCCC